MSVLPPSAGAGLPRPARDSARSTPTGTSHTLHGAPPRAARPVRTVQLPRRPRQRCVHPHRPGRAGRGAGVRIPGPTPRRSDRPSGGRPRSTGQRNVRWRVSLRVGAPPRKSQRTPVSEASTAPAGLTEETLDKYNAAPLSPCAAANQRYRPRRTGRRRRLRRPVPPSPTRSRAPTCRPGSRPACGCAPGAGACAGLWPPPAARVRA
jgi:hypothetical protein